MASAARTDPRGGAPGVASMTPTIGEVSDHRRYRRHLDRELDNVALYRDLAERAEAEHRDVLLGLAAAEERHARYWEAKLNELGFPVTPGKVHRPALTTRLLAWLGRRVGVRRLVPLLERIEASERTRYDNESAATTAMAAEERVHAELVAGLAPAWRSRVAGAIRAAVFGINDGLVSNLALVMGMAGGQAGTKVIVLAGIAGLVGGAGSMAAGEYISVRSQRELVEAGSALRPHDLVVVAERDPVALELLGKALGARHGGGREDPLQPAAARDIAELGSPRGAATSSFSSFALGASIPVLPFLFTSGAAALVAAAALAAAALFLVGAGISLVTNRPTARAGLRQLAVGAAAATGTYLVGRAVGVVLS